MATLVAPVVSGRSRRGQSPERVSAFPRERSAQAAVALERFDRLRHFFSRDAQMADALGWDHATVAEWRGLRVVRPQRAKAAMVALLLALCEEARPYLDNAGQVGQWVNTPLPNLHGCTPSRWIRERGRTGLDELARGMLDWAPRPREEDLEPVDDSVTLARLRSAARHDETARELQHIIDAIQSKSEAQQPSRRPASAAGVAPAQTQARPRANGQRASAGSVRPRPGSDRGVGRSTARGSSRA
jgi:hypothetical protein